MQRNATFGIPGTPVPADLSFPTIPWLDAGPQPGAHAGPLPFATALLEVAAVPRTTALASTSCVARSPERVRLADVATLYERAVVPTLQSPGAARRDCALILAYLGPDTRIADLTELRLTIFVLQLAQTEQLANASTARVLSTLRRLLVHAVAGGRLDAFPAAVWKGRPLVRNAGRTLNHAEVMRLWAACQTRQERRYLRLLLGTLASPGEVRALAAPHLDRTEGAIWVRAETLTASAPPYRVPLLPQLAAEIGASEQGLLLAIDGAEPADLTKAFRELRKRAGLDAAVTANALRITGAQHLIACGMPENTVRIYLGDLPIPGDRRLPADVAVAASHLDALCQRLMPYDNQGRQTGGPAPDAGLLPA